MKKVTLYLLAATPFLLLSGCAAVSFTHAIGTHGRAVTNAEVQPENTVVLTYPDGSACIDTHPGESQVCKPGGP